MKMATASGSFFFTCCAPCTSISSTRSSPVARASSSCLRGVPYQCFPKHLRVLQKLARATLRSNSASEMKSYHFPGLSVGARRPRGARNGKHHARQASSLCTSVDLPEPEGPETMNDH